jgi:predicted dehydrogenase
LNPRPPAMPITWRDDATLSAGGSIADVGSHSYDTVRWLLGIEAKRVLVHADVITPAKLDLGNINLAEALEHTQATNHLVNRAHRKGTTYDYANIAWEFEGGAIGSIIVSHAPFLRKGLAPELELHGTEASLSVDRFNGRLTLFKQDQKEEVIAVLPGKEAGNRFEKFVFPNLRKTLSGLDVDYPNLEDGWRVQLFTDAAAESARTGTWQNVEQGSSKN